MQVQSQLILTLYKEHKQTNYLVPLSLTMNVQTKRRRLDCILIPLRLIILIIIEILTECTVNNTASV